MIFDKNSQKPLKLTPLSEARRIAKTNSSPTEKIIPIKLISLKEARELRRSSNSSRPDSVLSLPDQLSFMNSLDEDLKFRDVSSLSPKESAVSSSRSVKPKLAKEHSLEEVKLPEEPVISSKFDEHLKPDLPQINEKIDYEEHTVEEILENSEKIAILKEPETTEDTQKTKVRALNRPDPLSTAKHKLLYPSKILKQTGSKLKHALNMPKRQQGEVLKFMDEPKLKKKLTRSQERGLLDRLQGGSTKGIKN